MPEIKVTDHFTANAEYIEKYVGVNRYRERGGYEPGFFCGALRGRKSGWKG